MSELICVIDGVDDACPFRSSCDEVFVCVLCEEVVPAE